MSAEFVNKLQRQHLAELVPYQSARRSMSGGSTWLNANEAPQTPAFPEAPEWNRYPSFQNAALNQAYADYAGLKSEQVLSCRGSDEAIDLLIRAFCEPVSDAVMITTPTYGMYAISAATQGAAVADCPLIAGTDDSLQLDVAAMLQRLRDAQQPRVKLIFVCSPSNPLGNLVDSGALEALLEGVGQQALVVLDQAYVEFIEHNSGQVNISDWLARYPQLVVLRTLSKAFGLAGLRCGFAIGQPEVMDILRKVIAPYPLPEPTISGATAALSTTGIQLMQAQVTATLEQRERLLEVLQNKAWVEKIWPSVTNFVLISVADAAAIVQQCQQAGVLIRNQSSQPGLSPCVRISIGSAEEMDQLFEVLPA